MLNDRLGIKNIFIYRSENNSCKKVSLPRLTLLRVRSFVGWPSTILMTSVNKHTIKTTMSSVFIFQSLNGREERRETYLIYSGILEFGRGVFSDPTLCLAVKFELVGLYFQTPLFVWQGTPLFIWK